MSEGGGGGVGHSLIIIKLTNIKKLQLLNSNISTDKLMPDSKLIEFPEIAISLHVVVRATTIQHYVIDWLRPLSKPY